MIDFIQRLQLALGDVARRSALKVVAGIVLAVGAGFLVAALWSWLAHGLGWGATMASLAVGAGFALIGVAILTVASRPRHIMPTGEDLRREVEAQVNHAADAAVDRARTEARRVADLAESRVGSLMGSAGLSSESIGAARRRAADAADRAARAADSNAGSMAKLIGAFAIGVTLASRLGSRRPPPGGRYGDEEDRDS